MQEKKIIAIAGSTGMIGKAARECFSGYTVIPVYRSDFALEDMEFTGKFENADILMNFSGEPIIGRWNKKNREKITRSRLETTRKMGLVCEMGLEKKRIFLSASAIGIYNEKGFHDETSGEYGKGFLAELVGKWENEAMRFKTENTRVCILRIGIVLSREGGILKRLKPMIKMHLGAILGNGKQHFSFIHVDDLTGILKHIVKSKESQGIYNMVSPEGNTHRDFMKIIAEVMGKRIFFRIPEMIIRLVYGEAAEILIRGQNVYPGKAIEEGYRFRHPGLAECLEDLVD